MILKHTAFTAALLTLTILCLGADPKPPTTNRTDIIAETQGQLGRTSRELYLEFTTTSKGFRVNYKIEGSGPYHLTLQKQEYDAGGQIVWRQVDVLIHTARGAKVGGQTYRTAPPGTYRVQLIGQNADYHLIVDNPTTNRPSSNPAK